MILIFLKFDDLRLSCKIECMCCPIIYIYDDAIDVNYIIHPNLKI